MSAFDRYLEPPEHHFAPGEEDLLGSKVFVEEEDAWGEVVSAEEWEDAERDEDGGVCRYGGVNFTIRMDERFRSGGVREISMTQDDLEELVAFQDSTPIQEYYRPTCKHCNNPGVHDYCEAAMERERLAAHRARSSY
jgi:hypothetical protein